MRIGKVFKFEAAHQLPNHDGKCRNLHGHSYRVEVELEGDPRSEGEGAPDEGMVLDFSALSAIWKRAVHARLDHRFLNDVIPDRVTTAENIAAWILDELVNEFERQDLDAAVAAVTVWETATSWARAE